MIFFTHYITLIYSKSCILIFSTNRPRISNNAEDLLSAIKAITNNERTPERQLEIVCALCMHITMPFCLNCIIIYYYCEMFKLHK